MALGFAYENVYINELRWFSINKVSFSYWGKFCLEYLSWYLAKIKLSKCIFIGKASRFSKHHKYNHWNH